MKTVKVGIAGAAGYTGCELIRLLAMHPHAEISWLMTGKTNEGKRLHEVFPHLREVPERVFQPGARSWRSRLCIPWSAVPCGLRALNAFAIAGDAHLACHPLPGDAPDFHQPGSFPAAFLEPPSERNDRP